MKALAALLHSMPPATQALAGVVVGAAVSRMAVKGLAAATAAAARAAVAAAGGPCADEGGVVGFESLLADLARLKGGGPLQVGEAKAWIRSLPEGEHAASLLGKLSAHRNLKAHAQAQRLVAEVQHLQELQAQRGEASDGGGSGAEEDPGERLARLQAHVQRHPRDAAAARRLRSQQGEAGAEPVKVRQLRRNGSEPEKTGEDHVKEQMYTNQMLARSDLKT